MRRISFFVIVLLLVGNLIANAQFRIIGGSAVDISQRPYQAAVFINGSFMGGGVVLSPYHILTAGHVVCNIGTTSPVSTSSIKVSVGYTNLNNDNDKHSVQSVTVHSQYYYEYPSPYYKIPQNDIAIIKLSNPLTYGTNIQPIEISSNTSYSSGTQAVVSGWGQRGVSENVSLSQLYKTGITISSCSPTNIEAVASLNTAYHGDSGGPLTIISNGNEVLIGLVSYGSTNSPTTNPSYYTNVGNYYDWILSNMVSLSGPSQFFDEAIYTVSNIPAGYTVEWEVGHPGVMTITPLADNGSQVKCTMNYMAGDAYSSITAHVKYNGNVVKTLTKNVHTGLFITNIALLNYCSLNLLQVQTSAGTNSIPGIDYDWSAGNGVSLVPNPYADDASFTYQGGYGGSIYPIVNSSGVYSVSARIKVNGYIVSDWYTTSVYLEPESPFSPWHFMFNIYPNPTTDLVTITTTSDSPFEVQLWNGNHMVRKMMGRDRSAQLSVSGLPSGLYYVVVMKDGKTYRQKLIVK